MYRSGGWIVGCSHAARAAATASDEPPPPPLPEEIVPLKEALEEPERRIIERALKKLGGSRQRTAEALDINRTTLFNKMKKYDLLDRY